MGGTKHKIDEFSVSINFMKNGNKIVEHANSHLFCLLIFHRANRNGHIRHLMLMEERHEPCRVYYRGVPLSSNLCLR